uniref:Uncharacterized protein n=1 Tax=Oryza rufipogon TaxID=4529 RepID=A0A0E0QYC4_ORYRU
MPHHSVVSPRLPEASRSRAASSPRLASRKLREAPARPEPWRSRSRQATTPASSSRCAAPGRRCSSPRSAIPARRRRGGRRHHGDRAPLPRVVACSGTPASSARSSLRRGARPRCTRRTPGRRFSSSSPWSPSSCSSSGSSRQRRWRRSREGVRSAAPA